jgi:hypothetical protein
LRGLCVCRGYSVLFTDKGKEKAFELFNLHGWLVLFTSYVSGLLLAAYTLYDGGGNDGIGIV